jgi:aryl-alcohol dehydrogenase-like predicted oxidoreductase
MIFGDEGGYGASRDESRAIYDAYLEAGGNFIDTANIYTNGTSEKFLGEFTRENRERVMLATKYTNAMHAGDANAGGNHRKSMMQSVEASLKRLGTDYIDLYWMHVWDGLTPVEVVMRGFDDLVRQGKVLYVGISDAPAWWIAQANMLADLRGWSPFVGLQIEYSLIERTPEHELLPMAKAQGLTVTAWSPLAGGTLSGKYLDKGSDAAKEGRYGKPELQGFMADQTRSERIAREVVEVAKELGVSASQVALAWLRYRDQPVIPIIGTRKLTQLQDNLASLNLNLSIEQVKRLDDVSTIEPIFPNSFFANEIVRNLVYGGMRDSIDA